MKKKILASALASCLLVPAALTFGGCKDATPSFTVGQNILTKTETILDNITNNIYNKLTPGSYEIYQIQQQPGNAQFQYYVDIGTVSEIDDIESITIGNVTMQEDEEFKLSVGQNAFIKAECFKEEDDRIYVAAPILAFETVNNSTIKINNLTFDFNLNSTETKQNFTSVTGQNSSISIEKVDDSKYNVALENATSYLKFAYPGNTSDPIITKKVVNNRLSSYGIMAAENPILLYPCGYSATFSDAQMINYDGKDFNYEVYVPGVGIYSVTLALDLIRE